MEIILLRTFISRVGFNKIFKPISTSAPYQKKVINRVHLVNMAELGLSLGVSLTFRRTFG